MARFNRSIANPVVRRFAGWLPPLAIVLHRGRRTGHAFATPVLAFGTADGLVVGVLYGGESDWVRNVQAAGRAQVKRRGVVRNYQRAQLIGTDEGIRLLPTVVGVAFRALKVRSFILLETASAADSAAWARSLPATTRAVEGLDGHGAVGKGWRDERDQL